MNIAFLVAISATSVLWTGSGWADASVVRKAAFRLLTPDGSQQIGWADFDKAEQRKDPLHLRIVYRFSNGDYDIDESWLKPARPGQIPSLRRYHHAFFRGDGSLERLSEADVMSGQATCSIYKDGEVQRTSKALDFPADTYAGPALVLPIRNFLRHQSSAEPQFHSFNCTPGPEIYTINISAEPVPHSSYDERPERPERPMIEAIVRPYLGPFDILIRPFMPTVRLWFDPLHDFEFVGVQSSRYYRGLPFLMLSERSVGRELRERVTK